MKLDPTKIILGLLGPAIAAASGWLSAAVAKYGIHASKTGIAVAIGAGVIGAVVFVVKLIHDVETGQPVNLAADVKTAEQAAAQADPQLAQELGWPPDVVPVQEQAAAPIQEQQAAPPPAAA